MNECQQFPAGSRKRQICTGEAQLPLAKINVYRASWGLLPLEDNSMSRPLVVIHSGTVKAESRRTQQPTRQASCPCVKPKRKATAGPGFELLAIMAGRNVPSCQACKDQADKMNEWGVGECRKRISEIVEEIFPRAKDWIAKKNPWVHSLLPEIVEDIGLRLKLRSIVNEAIDAADLKEAKQRLRGMDKIVANCVSFTETTQPIFRIRTAIRTSYRREATLQRTIDSMQAGGFESPTIYADFNTPEIGECVRWPEQYKPFKSFVEMSLHMLAEPGWMLLCEDDVIFRAGVADYLREQNLNPDQVVSLYMAQTQEAGLKGDGFGSVTGDVWGSLAYLIHSEALMRIINSETFANWSKTDRVDRAFNRACLELGIDLLCHRPALADHIGETSTLVTARHLDVRRTSRFEASRHTSGLVTLITPTGDRPEAFALCERWVNHQQYTGPVQWIVVDDGHVPTEVSHADIILRPTPMSGHSLCRNLREAMPHIKGEHVFVIEDDDYYGPDYLSVMVGRLQHADLVGEFGAKYYYLREQKWRHNLNETHASLCRTGFNKSVLPIFADCARDTDHPSVDLRLWSEWKGSRLSWTDPLGVTRMCVGIKGVSGRQSHGWKPSPSAVKDSDSTKITEWIGADQEFYKGS